MVGQLLRTVVDLLPLFAPRLGYTGQYLAKAGHPIAGFFGVIGSAKEGLPFGGEHGRERPAPLSAHGNHRAHVNLVYIRSLFPIYFNVDEVLVHESGRGFILKALMRHHMAPMASGVANAQ